MAVGLFPKTQDASRCGGNISRSNSSSTLAARSTTVTTNTAATIATPTATTTTTDNMLEFTEESLTTNTGLKKEPPHDEDLSGLDLELERELGLFSSEKKSRQKGVVVPHQTSMHKPGIETSPTLAVAMTRAGKYHLRAQAQDSSDKDPVHDLGTAQPYIESGAKTKAKTKETAKSSEKRDPIAEGERELQTFLSAAAPSRLTASSQAASTTTTAVARAAASQSGAGKREALSLAPVLSTATSLVSTPAPLSSSSSPILPAPPSPSPVPKPSSARRVWFQNRHKLTTTAKSKSKSKPATGKPAFHHQLSTSPLLLSLCSYSPISPTATTTLTFQPSSPSLFSSYSSPTFASATFSYYNKNKRNKQPKRRSHSSSGITTNKRYSLVPQVPPLPSSILALTAVTPGKSSAEPSTPPSTTALCTAIPTPAPPPSSPLLSSLSRPPLEQLGLRSSLQLRQEGDGLVHTEQNVAASFEADLETAHSSAPLLDTESCASSTTSTLATKAAVIDNFLPCPPADKSTSAISGLESDQASIEDEKIHKVGSRTNDSELTLTLAVESDLGLAASRYRNLSVVSTQTAITTASEAPDFDDSASLLTVGEPLEVFTAATAVRAAPARAEVINVRRPATAASSSSSGLQISVGGSGVGHRIITPSHGPETAVAPASTTIPTHIPEATPSQIAMRHKQPHGLSLSNSHPPASLAHIISPGSLKSELSPQNHHQHIRNHTIPTSILSPAMLDGMSPGSNYHTAPPAQLSAKEFGMLPPTIQRKAHDFGDSQIYASRPDPQSRPDSQPRPLSQSRPVSPLGKLPSPRLAALQTQGLSSSALSPAAGLDQPHTPVRPHNDDDSFQSHSPKIFPTPGKQLSSTKPRTKLADKRSYNISDLVRRRSRASSLNSSFYASLPDKIQRRHLDLEEQNIAARHRKRSVRAPTLSSTDRLVLDWTRRRPSSNPTPPQSVYGEEGFIAGLRGSTRRRRSFDTQLDEDGNVAFDNPFHKQATVLISPSDIGSDSPINFPQTPASATLFPPPPLQKMEHALASRKPPSTQSGISGHRPSLSTPMAMLASSSSAKKENFMESFRWLDEEEDLDLKLHLDDYHQNLRAQIPVSTSKARPSFRRHLSINKMPFSRPVQTGSRPSTKDSVASIQVGPYGPVRHNKRRSRALSLMTPRQTPSIGDQMSPISPIDETAHYSDPNARLKLRLYLASPQKFDEAIQYGFPAAAVDPKSPALPLSLDPSLCDSMSMVSPKTTKPQRTDLLVDDKLCTFLTDDKSSVCSGAEDDLRSSPEFEAPPTPQTPPEKNTERDDNDRKGLNSMVPATKPKISGSEPAVGNGANTNTISRSPVVIVHGQKSTKPHTDFETTLASREMTLRMTLTRPDLRSDDDQIYGWSNNQSQNQPAVHVHTRPPSQTTSRQLSPVISSHRKVFSSAGFDYNNASPSLISTVPESGSDSNYPPPLNKTNDGNAGGVNTLEFGRNVPTLRSSSASPDPQSRMMAGVGLGLVNHSIGLEGSNGVGSVVLSGNAMNAGSGLSSRDSSFAKESIERQFAAFDLDMEQDRGMMKRIWHRVRRN
ncbi:hypothetical protein HOO65_010680 [Ceratocystis lukuohia]|uniref:Uncharacterized protein n=1 Tax=Ceratocystis lukuohia TaxID=2019550 RepID=A0ABR4MSR3_9PEZI